MEEFWTAAECAEKIVVALVKDIDAKNSTVLYEKIQKAAKIARKAKAVRNAAKQYNELIQLLEE